MKKENLKKKLLPVNLAILWLGLYWVSVGLFVGNTRAMAAWEFTVDTPFGVNNPFPNWDNKLNDPYYKDIRLLQYT